MKYKTSQVTSSPPKTQTYGSLLNLPSKMPPQSLYIIIGFILLIVPKVKSYQQGIDDCSMSHLQVQLIGGIGGVIELSSRVGKEQKIAIELAVHDFHDNQTPCSRLDLHLQDSHGNSARAVSAVTDLAEGKRVQAIIGTLTPQDTVLVFEFSKVDKDTPIISISSTAKSPPLVPQQAASFIQMSNDITNHIQCIAAIISHFRWRKVTPIYEHSYRFAADSALIIQLSESLRWVDSATEHPLAFPPISSLSSPEPFIEEELHKLILKNSKVFILVQSSLQFSILLFEKAKQMGMMGEGYAWIVSDDVANLLDSVNESVISNMQGVIGLKTKFDTGESFKQFKVRFRRRYRVEYPEEEEYSNPGIYALRAYDATWAIANAMQNSPGSNTSKHLLENILASDFEGLSGHISFKNGKLAESPTFQIINVIGKSYREIALWSPEFGFLEDFVEKDVKMRNGIDLLVAKHSSIYWPGGVQTVPKGWTLGKKEKPLKIGVPARSACNLFVKVTYDQGQNERNVTGFTIDVFYAVVKQLPYHLSYVLVPYYGSYDEMVAEVYNKSLDAAVGDTDILADRYEYAQFSQPYMESGVVMVVTTKPGMDKEKFMFMKAFKMEMWILMAGVSMSTGFVIWLTEHVANNPDFEGWGIKKFGEMLWFSITILSFAHRESIKSNLSRFVLATWLFFIMIVTACFTAILASMMTVTRLQPSVLDINYLQRTNAAVGCNGNGFVFRYLVNFLHFSPNNIKRINSIKDYPEAFKRGEIAAAFFIAPHAKVFLAENCQGYTMAGHYFKLGGLGFVFSKGSPLAEDVSEAILKVTQSGELDQLERRMLSFSNCSSLAGDLSDVPSLGYEPFSGMLIIYVSITAAVFIITAARIVERRWMTWSRIRSTLAKQRFGEWLALILGRIYTNNQIGTSDVMKKRSLGLELAKYQ